MRPRLPERDGTWAVLSLAAPRSPWASRVTAAANDGRLPAEVVKCVSSEDVLSHLGSSRPWSALLLDGSLPEARRDLMAAALAASCSVIIVAKPGRTIDWETLGAVSVVAPDLTIADLASILRGHAPPIRPSQRVPAVLDPGATPGEARPASGSLVAVIGSGGAGVSTLAIATAQGLGADRRVLLADLALRADQAMLHDSREVVPGVQELVEAHAVGTPPERDVVAGTFRVAARGYHLLVGLRRARDWTTLRPRAVNAALISLRSAFDVVVADCSPDLDGEEQTGSADVEDRNLLTRTAVLSASTVLAVGRPTMAGVHSLVRLVHELIDVGVDPTRVVLVMNGCSRNPRSRAGLTRSVGQLLASDPAAATIGSPLHLPARPVEGPLRRGAPLPRVLANRLAAVVCLDATSPRRPAAAEGTAVVPGELGLAGTEVQR